MEVVKKRSRFLGLAAVGSLLYAGSMIPTAGPQAAPVDPGAFGARPAAAATVKAPPKTGEASWYGPRFHGRPTASGERFDMHAMTAAHRKLPLGSKVRVTNLENDRSVVVKVNDRGPFARGRIIDVSYGAAKRLGMVASGTARVEIAPV
jgi:rare lipoprotein A